MTAVTVARDRPFHLLTVGWHPRTLSGLFDGVERRTGIRMSHIPFDVDPAGRADVPFYIRESDRRIGAADNAMLAALEQPGIPAVRTMILGDDVVRRLSAERALAYATFLARRFTKVFSDLQPNIVIGGFDGLHSAIAFAVARKVGIPWLALHFSVIPKGLSGFCDGLSPGHAVPLWPWAPGESQELAERTLKEFEEQSLTVPAYRSANSTADVMQRFPAHLQTLLATTSRALSGRFDEFTEYSPWYMCRRYLRKRTNLWRLPQELLSEPPDGPFVLYGLHRQPESSVDVWAPFSSDQFAVVAAIAKATPPTHAILVKLHRSDADNYSPSDLARFTQLPGVRLVSPLASSRAFVDRAALVFAIHGTLALEAALLRKPVVIFGDSKLTRLPGVARVTRLPELPELVRSQLSASAPSRQSVISGFADYLSGFAPGCYNDWDAELTTVELDKMAQLFAAMRDYIERRSAAHHASRGQPATVGEIES